jgi:small subunit ribosomal protein S16
MSLVIRMSLRGRTNRTCFRVGVWDTRSRRDGPPVEDLGWYDPRAKDATKQFLVKGERVSHWIGEGARISDTVRSFLKRAKIAVPARSTTRVTVLKDAKRRAASASRRAAAKPAKPAKPAKKA